jgi:hypothetical protein
MVVGTLENVWLIIAGNDSYAIVSAHWFSNSCVESSLRVCDTIQNARWWLHNIHHTGASPVQFGYHLPD